MIAKNFNRSLRVSKNVTYVWTTIATSLLKIIPFVVVPNIFGHPCVMLSTEIIIFPCVDLHAYTQWLQCLSLQK